jgi:hypothetical protein
MWKKRWKKSLILLDFKAIHRVFHNIVENSADFPTVFHRKIEFVKSPKENVYTLVQGYEDTVSTA